MLSKLVWLRISWYSWSWCVGSIAWGKRWNSSSTLLLLYSWRSSSKNCIKCFNRRREPNFSAVSGESTSDIDHGRIRGSRTCFTHTGWNWGWFTTFSTTFSITVFLSAAISEIRWSPRVASHLGELVILVEFVAFLHTQPILYPVLLCNVYHGQEILRSFQNEMSVTSGKEVLYVFIQWNSNFSNVHGKCNSVQGIGC